MSDGFTTLDGEITMSLEQSSGVGSIANNLTTTNEGYALDARQGKVLEDKKLDKANVMNNISTSVSGYALDARQGKWLDENKIGYGDIANNIETEDPSKVLGASMGVYLMEQIDEVALEAGEIREELEAVTNAIGIGDDAIDLKGKYLDNALFR